MKKLVFCLSLSHYAGACKILSPTQPRVIRTATPSLSHYAFAFGLLFWIHDSSLCRCVRAPFVHHHMSWKNLYFVSPSLTMPVRARFFPPIPLALFMLVTRSLYQILKNHCFVKACIVSQRFNPKPVCVSFFSDTLIIYKIIIIIRVTFRKMLNTSHELFCPVKYVTRAILFISHAFSPHPSYINYAPGFIAKNKDTLRWSRAHDAVFSLPYCHPWVECN